mmetsp:Transcript_3315/g.5034  ORF Transcript_3315/g.5034 Transcript_3315/m.5034 type:complete len:513 (-) Transcript_3315:107-1645(-)
MKFNCSSILCPLLSFLQIYNHGVDAEQHLRNPSSSRELIIGGVNAAGGEFPFIATWHKKDIEDHPNCAGSLVAPNLVLTSASCFPSNGPLRVGSLYPRLKANVSFRFSGIATTVQEKVLHPNYENDERNDFLLLVLSDDIDTNAYPIVELDLETQPSDGDTLTMIGFGTQSLNDWLPANSLKKVDLTNVNYNTCVQQYNDIVSDSSSPPRYYELSRTFHLCTTGVSKDACYGDTGGPILKRSNGKFQQVGIISTGNGCALSVGVYPRLSAAASWLTTEICTRSSDPKPQLCNQFTDPPTTSLMPSESRPSAEPTSSPSSSPTTSSPSEAPSNSPTKFTLKPSITPSFSPSITPGPSESPTECEGDICENDPPDHFRGDYLNCNTVDLTTFNNKCTYNSKWTLEKYCRLSCFRAGLAYEGDFCCNANDPIGDVPTKSPTASPTLQSGEVEEENCTECDNRQNEYMLTLAIDCETSHLTRDKCNKNAGWREKTYCRLSCYKAGNGYSGDNCCTQ